jgi:hypothetical protein
MGVSLRPILLAALAIACTRVATGPPAVQPALTALAHLGYLCGDAEKEISPPNDLYQWHCHRSNPGPSNVLVEGNGRGVATFVVGVDDTDPVRMRQAFAEVLAEVPPLSTASWLAAGLDGWTGPQASRSLNGIRVTGLCDATQCMVYVVNAASPIEPLPLSPR